MAETTLDPFEELRAKTQVQLEFQDTYLTDVKHWYIQPINQRTAPPEYGVVSLFVKTGPYRLQVYPKRFFKFHFYKGDRLLFQSTNLSSLATLRQRFNKPQQLICSRPETKLL